MHNQKHTTETKKLIGKKAKKMWENPEIRKKIIDKMKGRPAPNKGEQIKKICPSCEKEFEYPIYLRRKYCSKKCYTKAMIGKPPQNKGKPRYKIRGKNNPNWKGGVRRTHSEHARKVCELAGIDIKNKEVHHINGDYTDQRLENLQVMTKSEHMRLHRKQDGLRPLNRYEQLWEQKNKK